MSDYTITAAADVDDVLGDYPGEMRMFTEAIGAEQVAFTYRRMPPKTGGKGTYGHSHRTQEEVYFVISGTLQFKLGDEVVDVGPPTTVQARRSPGAAAGQRPVAEHELPCTHPATRARSPRASRAHPSGRPVAASR